MQLPTEKGHRGRCERQRAEDLQKLGQLLDQDGLEHVLRYLFGCEGHIL